MNAANPAWLAQAAADRATATIDRLRLRTDDDAADLVAHAQAIADYAVWAVEAAEAAAEVGNAAALHATTEVADRADQALRMIEAMAAAADRYTTLPA